MTEEMNKLIDLMRATSKFDTNNPEFDRGWAAAMSVVISELRGLKELEPEPCQCPSEPSIDPRLAKWTRATWDIDGKSVEGWERMGTIYGRRGGYLVTSDLNCLFYTGAGGCVVPSSCNINEVLSTPSVFSRNPGFKWADEPEEPSIADDPKASWRFDGEKYTRVLKIGGDFAIYNSPEFDIAVFVLRINGRFLGTYPTPEKAMELADEYAQANGGWAG